jgi:hypothetical protein
LQQHQPSYKHNNQHKNHKSQFKEIPKEKHIEKCHHAMRERARDHDPISQSTLLQGKKATSIYIYVTYMFSTALAQRNIRAFVLTQSMA